MNCTSRIKATFSKTRKAAAKWPKKYKGTNYIYLFACFIWGSSLKAALHIPTYNGGPGFLLAVLLGSRFTISWQN